MMLVGKRFIRYCSKVYGLGKVLRNVRLGSPAPRRIPAWPKLLAVLVGIWTRRGSLHRLERLSKGGRLNALLGIKGAVSADTLGRALREADPAGLRRYNGEIVRKARHNKVFGTGTIAGWMVAVLDGTETYRTQRPARAAREGWKRRCLSSSAGVVEHYEVAVGLAYVGQGPRLALGIGRVRPGEAESAAGLRLIKELDAQLGWSWCDVLCLDAHYAQAPFINAVRERHKHVIVRAKQTRYRIIADAEGLFRQRGADVYMRNATCRLPGELGSSSVRYQVEIWEEEDLTSWQGMDEPLRCLKVRERKEVFCNGAWVADGVQESFIVTTIPAAQMKAQTVWLIMHRRWDVENSLFNDLKQNWAFEHCYIHDPRGIESLYALYAIAFNLKLLFAYRQLGYGRKRGPTLVELGDLLLMDWGTSTQTWWEFATAGSRPRDDPA